MFTYRRFILFLALCLFIYNGDAQQAKPFSKLSAALAQRICYTLPEDSVDLILVQKKPQAIQGFRLLHAYGNTVAVRVASPFVSMAVADNNVLFADLAKTPHEELTTGSLDLAVNKVNTAHDHFPAIDGAGILASIKEQQFDTTDIDYTGRYVNTAAAAPTATTHAAVMATTLAGGGNSSPFATGAAPGALVTSTSFTSLLPESDAYYNLFKISIQNHSYGTVPENYYGAEAAAYDQNVKAVPTLVHVFSAGNAGTAPGTGPYAGVQGWSNLTGNFKTAKNVIVVGAIDSFYKVAAASSKGPAFDGRVKPELVAFGEDGSSGAAALTAGTVALLQQAYKAETGQLPSAALVKATLLNSADAVAQKHLSYASGYGSLNSYNAAKTLAEKHFFEDSLQHGVLKKFSITVPPHAAKLKVTLAWTDAPATVNTAHALVNDLDAVLKNGRESWLPWVLNPAADSLAQDAVRTQDTINNIEQITIDAPAAGTYQLEVSGSRVVTGTQAFAIAYQIDTADYFEWTFPVKRDNVIAGQTNVVRWQTTIAGTGRIEYTLNGQDWTTLTDTANMAQGYFKWAAPDTLATAQLRMGFLKSSPALSDTFVISKTIDLSVGFLCADSALFFWKAAQAPLYQVYNLAERYLQPVATTTDTTIIFKTLSQRSPYYSVAPVINGKAGLRSYTINYTAQGVGCYFRSFYTQAQDDSSATFALLLGTDYNIATIAFQKQEQHQFVTLQTLTAPATTAFFFTDTHLTAGGNRYRLQLTLRNGTVVTSDEISLFHFPDAAVFMYPNPARRSQPVTLLTSNGNLVHVAIYTTAGTLVQRLELNNIINRIATAPLPAGVYVVHAVKEDGTRSTQKLVIY